MKCVHHQVLRLTVGGLKLIDILVEYCKVLLHWCGLSQFVRCFHYYKIVIFPFSVKS